MNDRAAPFWALAAGMKRAHRRSEAARLRARSLRLKSQALGLLWPGNPGLPEAPPDPEAAPGVSEAERLRARSLRLASRAAR